MKLEKYNTKFTTKKLYEMANISKQKTGLPVMIWVSYNTGKEKHGARIKIKIDNTLIPISISDTPEVKASSANIKSGILKQITSWIVLNKKVLLKYWNAKGSLGIDYVLDNIIKVDK